MHSCAHKIFSGYGQKRSRNRLWAALFLAFMASPLETARAQTNQIWICVDRTRPKLDDGITQADIVARAIITACRDAILARVKDMYPKANETTQKLTASDVEKTLVNDVTISVLEARVSGRETSIFSHRIGSQPPSLTAFTAAPCEAKHKTCPYRRTFGSGYEVLTLERANGRIISQTFHENFANSDACLDKLAKYIKARNLSNPRAVSQSDVNDDPIFSGVTVLKYLKWEIGSDERISAACLQTGSNISFGIVETLSRVRELLSEEIDEALK